MFHNFNRAAFRIIIEGRIEFFQRFSSSKLVLKTVESRFAALNYYENGSSIRVNPTVTENSLLYCEALSPLALQNKPIPEA